MKKVIGWLVVFFFLAVYVVSDSSLMRTIAWERYQMPSAFASDKYRYGDLYGFSYLKEYKFPVDIDHKGYDDTVSYHSCSKKDINLYSLCDSYLFSFVKGEKDFCRVNKYVFLRSVDDAKLNVVLDKGKVNVLLIEITERQIRNALGDTSFLAGRLTAGQGPEGVTFNVHSHDLTRMSFNSGINTNLEFNLFDYHFLSPVKEFKAWFNKAVFNRVDGDVSVSSDASRLYYRRTTDTTDGSQSAFVTLTDKDIAHYVDNLNKLTAKFKKMGFDYIYFCGIPSPCTVYESGYRTYNGFLPRMQSDSNLKVQYIDMYSRFMKDRRPALYLRSDTHWDSTGFRVWQSVFNGILDTLPDHSQFLPTRTVAPRS